MSLKVFALVLAVAIGVSHAKPATADNDDVETFGNFPSNHGNTSPSFGDWGFFSLPDISAIQAYIDRVRQTIASTFAGATQGIDLSKGNTTSETKVVGDNIVTINRTVVDENGVHAVIQNVEVRPIDDDNTRSTGSTPAVTGSTTQQTRKDDIETFQDNDNEHEKSKESVENFDRIDFLLHNNLDTETMDEFPVEADLTHDIDVNKMAEKHYNDPDVEEFDFNVINDRAKANQYQQIRQGFHMKNAQPKEQRFDDVEEVFHDLSGDTYVNDLLARKLEGADWEQRQTRPAAYQGYQVYPEDVTNYRDLSRDTYVNELAAIRGLPKNPDAEEVDIQALNPAVPKNNALRKRHW